MEKTLVVAKAMFEMYNTTFHCKMDEMKMHKLMYFSQRESLIQNDEVLFEEPFCGWKYGPVLLSVREEFRSQAPFQNIIGEVTEATRNLLISVLERYGKMNSWKLSTLSHEEFSWKLSRTGLSSGDNGSALLSIDAMRIDAAREIDNRSNTVLA